MSLHRELYVATADALSEKLGREISPEDVAEHVDGRHGVPSDYFWAAWDNEVGALMDRWAGATGVEL